MRTLKFKSGVNLNLHRGFSLVEMAIVLIIFGLFLSATLVPLSAQRGIKDIADTRASLDTIKEAVYGFVIINGRLPCPTLTQDPSSTSYGVEDCSTSSINAEGYLPWKTLGVPEGDAWVVHRTSSADPWTGYWHYRVDANFAAVGTFNTSILATSSAFANSFSVLDSSGHALNTSAESPIAILYSLGKNLVADGQNASADTIYQSDDITTTFDDQLVWITRPTLVSKLATTGKLH